jgi:modulator of FtsH protease HflC
MSLSRFLPSSALLRGIGLVAGGLVAAVAACGLVAREHERVIVLRFGEPRRVLAEAGWHARLPWPLERVVRVDARLHQGELRLSETLTRDQRNLIAPMFYAWRVADPVRYLAALGGSAEVASQRLDALITTARNAALGQMEFDQLVSVAGGQETLARFEREVLAVAKPLSASQLGIELVDTGVLAINLPQANTEAVFRRMRAERKREAERYRAEGRREAETMKATTDREVAVILAEARREAEETRGRAEASAARIYAEAHGKDPEFYAFLRELQSLRTLVDRNTTLVLDTDAAPFRLLKDGAVAARTTPTPLSPLPLPAARPATRDAAAAAALADQPARLIP